MIRQAHQTGYILLPVIVVITLVAAIALLMNTESALESNAAAGELDAQQARYVAEAGLNHALWMTQQQGCGPYTDLTDEPLSSDKYSSKLTTDLGGTAAFTLSVDQDSWIRSDLPTENKATDLKLHTRNEILGTERPLLRYDLSPLAAKAQILSATAWFYITNAHAAGPIDIHLTSTNWTETDATWDSMNANMDSAVLATIPSQPAIGIWIPVNLTAQVQAWVNGQPNFGITLNSTVDGVHGQYNSRESANPPYLEVVVGTPPTSPATLKADATLANGVKRSIEDKAVTLVQHPAGFSLSRVTTGSGQDAMLDSFYNNRDYGVHELEVSLGSGSTLEHSLLQFELPAIAPGTRIISAQLELYHYVTTRSTGIPVVDMHRVTRSWIEGSHDGTGTADGASWETWDGSSNWASAGGDYEALSVASSEVSPATGDWESWEIGELVQGWIDGKYSNHGLLLKGTGDFDISFASREDADPARHPKLSITYTCACGEVCSTPQGSGKLLMVVVNPTVLVDEDQKAKDLFESWGYTVSVISESANQSSYDTAVSANDVVFISETVNSNQVGSKLANAPIGVVSQDGDYNPDLGLATGSTLKVGTDIDIVDTEHYITRVFPAAALPVYTAGMEQLVATGAFTADQQTLAQIGGDASLVVLDQGDAMEGGGNAAGRRVILPLGTRYRFNWDHLNANGRLLVQRALAWGVGAAAKSSGTVLLVVVDPGSLTAQEDAKKTLIEGWGYSVTLIDESDSQANFDAAAALADVAYVAEDITSGELGTKLREATIGVVIEEEKITDEFGISSGETTFTQASIEITDNTHYITEPFSLGTVTFSSSAQPVGGRAGTLAPGLAVLALRPSSSTSMLDVIDTGGVLFDTGTAAGRRVKLPWGGNGFDINSLTAEGLDIMRRALEWGAGVENSNFSTELLFVVADPSALTSAESAKKTLIESWGYTVNLIDDDTALADFQAATLVNGVAYVANTAVASSVGSKLFKVEIGVVNANAGLHDDFGFSTVRFVSSTNAPLDTLASHYITQPFGGGQVTLYASDQASGGAVGTLAADLDQIGLWSSGALSPLGGLVTLEAGAMTSIGENTPARRAQMPWDNLDVSTLTADGLTILQRSLEWAGGAEIDLGPIAHWKLDETVGPTAVDSEGGHDGTWSNDPTPAPAVIDGGLAFDGTDDYVDLTSDTELDDVFLGGATVMAWVYAEGWGENNYGRILDKSSELGGERDGWMIGLFGDKQAVSLAQGFTGGRGFWRPQDGSFPLNQWVQVVIAYDSSSDANDPVIYQNAVVQTPMVEIVPSGTIRSDESISLTLGNHALDSSRTFDGKIDDVRIYKRILSETEIADLYAANLPPGAASYTELYQSWSATGDDAWQTVDLGAFGVPANAVVEVAVINSDTGKEYFGGVRAVGSSLERRFALHEAEGGGVDAVTMHVQADAGSQIQHYSDKATRVSFILLGYWTGATYVERFDAFKAGANASWQSHDLGAYGVGANQVAEIAMSQTSTSVEWQVGLRRTGSGLARQVTLHETEGGGVDMVSMLVASDASSLVEVYAEADSVVDFHLLGYWSTPPGIYTETGGVQGQALSASTWELTNLIGFGVPADAIAQFVISNQIDDFSPELGVRAVGSVSNRVLQLQEAESGGGDLGTMHVNVDSASSIEWYSASGTSERFFYPVGWWVLSP